MIDDLEDVIAIVGLALRDSGAADLEDFWHNLCAGRESVVAVDRDELRRRGIGLALLAYPAYVPAVSCVADAGRVDV